MQEDETKLLQELYKKEQTADLLITKRPFPFNFLQSYDPFTASELYQEIADTYFSLNKYIDSSIYYLKAAEGYLKSNDPGSKSYSAHAYAKLADLYNTKTFYNPTKAVQYYTKASFYFSITGSFSISATKKAACGKILESQYDYGLAADTFKEAIELWDKAKMPANRALIYDDFIFCLIKSKRFKEAGDFMLEISSEKGHLCTFYMLMGSFCFYVANEDNDTSELLTGEEKKLYDSMNDLEAFDKILNGYLSKKGCGNKFSDLFDEVKSTLQPEHDIL